ncbi:MAG: helix-turn-helix domain-containing protein [Bacilli bacterium]|nr:helix-turn-helix domain-containing protein [Bacilli bacterium]
MNEIGELLRLTREESGVSLEEASVDLEIKPLILENIEDGNIGCFKDIFALKEYIRNYAKYLGLEPEKIIDQFNEYLFEYTSKIPAEDIEKAIKEKSKEEVVVENKIVSPYTNSIDRKNSKLKKIIIIIVAIFIALVVIWAIKAITIDNRTTNMISHIIN